MSGVFKKLKGTFQNAQQDIVDGLRALTSLDTQPRHEQFKELRAKHINLDAGGELLHSYQQAWAEMQVKTKESAKKAEVVHSMMVPMFKVWDDHTELVSRLEEEVRHIPGVIHSLQQSQELLDALRQDFAVAEKAMDMLENLCEELDQKKQQKLEMQKLAKYKAKKVSQSQKVKVDLAQSHAKKMADLESAKRERLQDRAEAFTSAFEDDVNYYKTHGHTDRAPTSYPTVTSLSNIEIDSDKQALDSFLSETTSDPENDGGELENSQESNAFIEDDYTSSMYNTSDYSVKEDQDVMEEEEEEDMVRDIHTGDMMPVQDQLRLTYDEELAEDDENDDSSNVDEQQQSGSNGSGAAAVSSGDATSAAAAAEDQS